MLINNVAVMSGGLSTAHDFLQKIENRDSKSIEWLQRKCSQYSVSAQNFTRDLNQVVSLFFKSTDEAGDAFEILGLSLDATNDEIKKAYRQLVKMHHPDLFHNESEAQQKIAEERFLKIQKAYETIEEQK